MSIPIEFVYKGVKYKTAVSKMPTTPVQYRLFSLDPNMNIHFPLIYISNPVDGNFIHPSVFDKDFHNAVGNAIIEGCAKIGIPVHE